MKTYFYKIIFFLFPFIIHAQVPNSADSLAVFLKTQPKDTLYVLALRRFALIQIQEKGNNAKADSIGNEILVLSEKLNFGRGIYHGYYVKTVVSQQRSDFQEMVKNTTKCYELAVKYKLTKYIQEAALNNIATAYDALGDKDNAMKYALMAIEFQEKNNFPYMKIDAAPYEKVGNVLKFQKKYEDALKYFQKELEIATKKKAIESMAVAEDRIGNVYIDLENQTEAIKHFKIGLEYAEKNKHLLLQTDFLSDLGRVALHFNQFEEAEAYMKRNEKMCRTLQSNDALSKACNDLGNLYKKQKIYVLAEKYFKEANTLVKKVGNPENIKNSNQELANFYAETKNYQDAYQFSVAASALKDSVFKKESVEKTQELLAKYETEKKETQIKLLQEEAKLSEFQNKATLGGSALLLLLLGLSGAFIYNRNKLKQLEETQQLRNKISADLHDEIGSTLSSISLLSGMTEQHLQQNQPEKAGKMMQKIYADSQQVMESMDDIIWTVNPRNDSLSKILLRLKEFAQPLVESRNIDFEFKANSATESLALSMEVRRNLYLIVKEAINNLVKYSQATKASVSFEKDGKSLQVTIQDNGKGFDSQAVTSRNGLKNMQQRATDVGGKLNINSESKTGTSIILTLSLS